jgi:hypothetical protein
MTSVETKTAVKVTVDYLPASEPFRSEYPRDTVLETIREQAMRVSVPAGRNSLIDACNVLAADVLGAGHHVDCATNAFDRRFDAALNVGLEPPTRRGWITVSSDGWIARITGPSLTRIELPRPTRHSNAMGALGAACLGSGRVFLVLLGRRVPTCRLTGTERPGTISVPARIDTDPSTRPRGRQHDWG